MYTKEILSPKILVTANEKSKQFYQYDNTTLMCTTSLDYQYEIEKIKTLPTGLILLDPDDYAYNYTWILNYRILEKIKKGKKPNLGITDYGIGEKHYDKDYFESNHLTYHYNSIVVDKKFSNKIIMCYQKSDLFLAFDLFILYLKLTNEFQIELLPRINDEIDIIEFMSTRNNITANIDTLSYPFIRTVQIGYED